MRIAVIIPAAGVSRRFNQALTQGQSDSGKSKIELELLRKPVFLHSVELFQSRLEVQETLLAVNPDGVEAFKFKYADRLDLHSVRIVPGGVAERWETVLRALEKVSDGITHVAVHDAARPLTSPELIDRVFNAAKAYPAVIPGQPVAGTLKRAELVASPKSADPLDAIFAPEPGVPAAKIHKVTETVDRTRLFEVQTPQVFEIGLLKRAYKQITDGKLTGKGITDDAGLVEALGELVHLVEGEPTNLKITLPSDVPLAEMVLKARKPKDPFGETRKKKLFDDDED